MDAAQRAHFEAYADGVNAYIEQHQKTLPLEFRFLTYFPHVWTVEDSMLVGLVDDRISESRPVQGGVARKRDFWPSWGRS